MIIKEMHILFDNLYQSTNSNSKEIIKPEEKDLRIHYATMSLINEELDIGRNNKAGYNDRLDRAEQFKELKRTIECIPVVVNGAYGKYKTIRYPLPTNYLNYVRADGIASYDCNGQTFTEVASTKKIAVVKFKEDTVGTGGIFYDKFEFNIKEGAGVYETMFDLTTSFPSEYYASDIQDMNSEEARFYIMNLFLEYINRKEISFEFSTTKVIDVSVHWETYSNYYYKNSFIFVLNNYTGTGTVTVQIQSEDTTPIYDDSTFAIITGDTIYDDSAFTGSNELFDGRMMDSEEISTQLLNPYGKTKYYSPILELDRKSIIAYHDALFGFSTFNLTYLGIPRLVNIHHRIDCEISPAFHDKIITRAVRGVKGDVGDVTTKNTQLEYLEMD